MTTSPVASIQRFCEANAFPEARVRGLMAPIDSAWSRYEKSELSQEAFIEAFEAECRGIDVAMDGAAFLDAFHAGLDTRDEMIGAVRALRGHVRLGCITNNVARGDSRPGAIWSLDELFEVVVESAKVGMRKPDPRIYLHTCELLQVSPEECVFLDDFGINLKAARELGMTTIRVDHTLSGLDELERVVGRNLR